MKHRTHTIKLSAAGDGKAIRFLSRCEIKLAEGKTTSTVTVTRTGSFTDPRYGRFEITKDMLLSMVKNFKAGTFGQDIFIDVNHEPGEGAAGKVLNLTVEGNRLRAEVEWTPYGIDSIKGRGFQYLSAEYSENYTDNEAGQQHGAVLCGAALTVRPVVKHLDPVRLSEGIAANNPVLIHPELLVQLSEEINTMHKSYLARLTAYLTSIMLAQPVVVQLCDAFESTAKALGEDKAALDALYATWETTGKTLSENIGTKTVQLSINAPEQSGKLLSEDDVKKLLAEDRQRQLDEAKQLSEKLGANKVLFDKLLSENDGIKGLSEESKKMLSSAADLITADMTPEQVTKLAEHQISIGNNLSVQTQLASLGFKPAGTVQLTQTDQRTALSLHDVITQNLKQTNEFAMGKLKLSEKATPFINEVLAQFDAMNAPRIAHELKTLSSGSTGISDAYLPVGFQRTVIREALSDLRVLELINTLTDPAATLTTQIPYEARDTSAVVNDGIVYEGQSISRASIGTNYDTAYIVPTKLGFLISNEVMYFTIASQVDWNAYARNVASNARYVQELLVRRICNALQRAADSWQAVTITAEAFNTQLNGSSVSTVKTAQFPIVRQNQVKDIKGTSIGAVTNPITVKLNNVVIAEYNGTGTQSAGTYYRVTNYNLGYVQFVNQSGAPVFPANTANTNITYNYATNVAKFDTDNGSVDLEKHLNGLLRVVGRRKAILADDRFVAADFMLMSNTLNDTITNASQFTESGKKYGTDTTMDGDLMAIKSVAAFASNAPSTDIGSERLILGQRGMLSYTVAKRSDAVPPFEVVDATGKATGQKQSYSEEYSAVKVPDPVRNRMTSIIAYSGTNR